MGEPKGGDQSQEQEPQGDMWEREPIRSDREVREVTRRALRVQLLLHSGLVKRINPAPLPCVTRCAPSIPGEMTIVKTASA